MPAITAASRDFRDIFFIRFPHLWNSGKAELLANQPVTRLLFLKRCKRAICFIRDASCAGARNGRSPVWALASQSNRHPHSLTTRCMEARLLTFRRLGAPAVSGPMFAREELLKLFEKAGAVRHGHFELSSGLHSGTYVQCALVLQYPRYAERLGRALAAEFHDLRVDCVASPALGGVILGHEVARALPSVGEHGVRAVFVERDSTGRMTLR